MKKVYEYEYDEKGNVKKITITEEDEPQTLKYGPIWVYLPSITGEPTVSCPGYNSSASTTFTL